MLNRQNECYTSDRLETMAFLVRLILQVERAKYLRSKGRKLTKKAWAHYRHSTFETDFSQRINGLLKPFGKHPQDLTAKEFDLLEEVLTARLLNKLNPRTGPRGRGLIHSHPPISRPRGRPAINSDTRWVSNLMGRKLGMYANMETIVSSSSGLNSVMAAWSGMPIIQKSKLVTFKAALRHLERHGGVKALDATVTDAEVLIASQDINPLAPSFDALRKRFAKAKLIFRFPSGGK